MEPTKGKAIKKRQARSRPNRIPTPEEFKRAREHSDAQFIGVDATSRAIRREFCGKYRLLSTFALLPQGDSSFRAYLMFKSDKGIQAATKSGLVDRVIDRIYVGLERRGRGHREDITLVYGVESDESLKRRGSSLMGWMR